MEDSFYDEDAGYTEECIDEEYQENPMCCERCQSLNCDCHGECCTYCNGYAWELEAESMESEG